MITVDVIKEVLHDAKESASNDCISLQMFVDKDSANHLQLKFKKSPERNTILDKKLKEEEGAIDINAESQHIQNNMDGNIDDTEPVNDFDPPIEAEKEEAFLGFKDKVSSFPQCLPHRGTTLPRDKYVNRGSKKGNIKVVKKSSLC